MIMSSLSGNIQPCFVHVWIGIRRAQGNLPQFTLLGLIYLFVYLLSLVITFLYQPRELYLFVILYIAISPWLCFFPALAYIPVIFYLHHIRGKP